MFRSLITSFICFVAGLSAVIARNDASAQTVGSYASTVDTSSGGADFITSSSPLPNGGVIMSSQYPGEANGGATYVAEAPINGYGYGQGDGQGYGYGQGYAYAENYGYAQQPMYAPQQAIYQAPTAYAQPYQYPQDPQVINNQSAQIYPQQQIQYQPAPAAYRPQSAPVSYQTQGYTAPVYQQTSYQQQNNQNQWQANNNDTRVVQLNTQTPDTSGLQWQTAGNTPYTAQAPNCCETQPPVNPYAYPPPPANPQYAPTAPTYAPYGATNPYPNRAKWKPLLPLRALPPGLYVGQGIVGQPVAYVDKEPFRNFLRYISF